MNTITKAQNFFVLGVACAGLTACGSGSLGPQSTSNFANVVGSNVVTPLNPAADKSQSNNLSDPNIGLVAYAAGLEEVQPRVSAFAGLQSGATVGAAQTTGTATYSGAYGVVITDNISRSTYFITADIGQSAGPVTLNADFDSGSLTGTGASVVGLYTSDVTVNGAISGTDVSGTVLINYSKSGSTPGNLTTTLDGLIGANSSIGAFHGADSNTAIAGGYIAEVDP